MVEIKNIFISLKIFRGTRNAISPFYIISQIVTLIFYKYYAAICNEL